MKIFCLEDNALVVMHLEMIIEEAGHELVGSASSFAEAKSMWSDLDFDLALIDIDLSDGRTGVAAAEWLHARVRLAAFVTGQTDLASSCEHLVTAIVAKPIDEDVLRGVFSDARRRLAVMAS